MTTEPQTPPTRRAHIPDPTPLLHTTPDLRAFLDGYPALYITLHDVILEALRARHAADTLTDASHSGSPEYDAAFAQGAVAGVITTIQTVAAITGDPHSQALHDLAAHLMDVTAAQVTAASLPEGTPEPFDLLVQVAKLGAAQRVQLASRVGLNEDAIITAQAAGRTAFLLSILHHAETTGQLPQVAGHLRDLSGL